MAGGGRAKRARAAAKAATVAAVVAASRAREKRPVDFRAEERRVDCARRASGVEGVRKGVSEIWERTRSGVVAGWVAGRFIFVVPGLCFEVKRQSGSRHWLRITASAVLLPN